MSGRRSWVVAALAFVGSACGAAADDAAPTLEFHRVHVPAGRLGDVPLGGDRYVPMPLADFEAAVTRARAAGAAADAEPPVRATAARWRASIDGAGNLVGTITCDIDAAAAGAGRAWPLGDLRVTHGLLVADPPRPATIGGLGAGLALELPDPGTYELHFIRPPTAADAPVFRLPLPPALATRLVLDLPAGAAPVLSGPAARRAVVVAPDPGSSAPWRIDVGPAAELTIAIEPRDRPAPSVAIWSRVDLSGPHAALVAAVVPATPWRAGRFMLEQEAELRVLEVRVSGDDPLDHQPADDGRAIAVTVPRWLDGSHAPLVIRGVAPATGAVWRLPLVRATRQAWAGGGAIVRVDPASAVRDLETEDCRVVPPETAAEWPVPDRGAETGAAAILRPAVYHVEQQGPDAALDVVLGPRTAALDVARVTTVDITPGAVRGRAACDVRVTGGEAFEITARVAPGWIIDAVDLDSASDEDAPPAVTPADRGLEWRVSRSPVGDMLRIGLVSGASGPRGVGLRIAGHRGGLRPGAAFTTADIDMVRFDGEAADAAVIDLRTPADASVEIAGRPAGWFEVSDRLAALVEEGTARTRIRGGDQAAGVEARIVQRRPPLDVRTEVRLEPRDDVLVETFTFECRGATGLDSLVVDFAEPGGEGLAWRVESPADVAVTARELDPAEGGLASRSDAVAASWLVALSPPVTGEVRLRAVRSTPFLASRPVPLAWVEGAVEAGGTVVIAAPAGVRPRLVNRWLRPLPVDVTTAAPPTEFAYGPPLAGTAAEVAPVTASADARAWAWRETVDCWCDESGATETESRYDVENEGRDALALSLPPGRRLDAVSVGGAVVPDLEFSPAGGTWRIPLPAGERRVEIVVRTVAVGRPGRTAWRVDPAGCGLDVPVLDRAVRLLVPPGLAIAAGGDTAAARLPWTARLFGGGVADRPAAATTGYRSEPVAAPRQGGAGVLLVSRRVIAGGAILAAVAAGLVTFGRGRGRPASAGLVVAVCGLAALWLPPAFVPVARAAWWGGLAGFACTLRPAAGWWRWRRRVAAACLAVAAAGAAPAAGEGRVFVTPGADGDMALVPEPLFRALAAHGSGAAAAIRVLACRVDARPALAGSEWRLSLEIDADAGGTLALDAGPGARWLEPPAAPAGVTAVVAGRAARLTAAASGRQTVVLGLVPAVERRGPVELATARIPLAPTATLAIDDGGTAVADVDCETATGDRPFLRATRVQDGAGGPAFDLSVAERVRLVWPVEPRDRLATTIRTAATTNDLSWNADGCRVESAIDIDAEAALLRSFVVRVDPRLVGVAAVAEAGAAPRLESLGPGRVLVELPEAARGSLQVRLAARMPLTDAVGVFDAPGIWLEGVPGEKRTVRLAAAADFEATLDPPPPAGSAAADLAARPPTRVLVRRRRLQLRATQRLVVSFAAGGMGLALEAQIDATALALVRIPVDVPVGCVVDRVSLVADDPADPAGRQPVDIAWTRTAADRVAVVVQQPRSGRFRLAVDARLERRPAPQGRLPLARARLGPAVPLIVSWTAAPPLAVAVDAALSPAWPGAVEVPDGAPAPEYAVTVDEAAEDAPEAAVAPPVAADGSSRVERAEVLAAFDERGRIHGLVRFDVVTGAARVRLRLPPGMRLFDALVDGRVVAAEPRSIDAWDVPLGDAAWPRTIFAVFAGDVGMAPVDGRPLEIAAPWLEGLSAVEVLWTLRPPVGFALKVAPPARLLDAAALDAARAAAGARLEEAGARIAAAAAAPDRERLVALAALRGAERGPPAEEAWRRAVGWDDLDATATAVAAADPLVVRAVPLADATRPARAAATVVLVAGAGLAWTLAARGRVRPDRG
jgi:hypothetical protein